MTARYARAVDGVVVEICDSAALATHHPDLAATFISCPTNVQQNWLFSAPSNWTEPNEDAVANKPKKSPKK